MITVTNLTKHFGGIRAVDGISINIAAGAITGLIGPNGAGKTTLFNTIAGVYPPTSGSITLEGESIDGLQAHQLFHKGVLRTFQIAQEFAGLSVMENLLLVPSGQIGESLFSTWLRRRQIHAQEQTNINRAWEVLHFLNIDHLANEYAGNLSGGQKKLLELGRTMMVDAKVVLLDEVGAGVNRSLLRDIGEAIIRLNREHHYTFCMIEHDIEFIERLCSHVIVMAEGKLLTQGNMAAIKQDQRVIEAYFGRAVGGAA